MPGRHFLFVPGPTNVPERVARAMVVPMEDHRSPKFPELTLPLFEGVRKIYKSKDAQIFLFPSSGTGAWESAFTNTLSPGDKVLMSRFGQFSHLWIDMAQRLGFEVQILEEEWGTGVKPEKIEEALRADKSHTIKAVCATHNETATGVASDIGAVRKAMDAAGHPALLFVDAVSSLGSLDFRQDEWGVDLGVSGSQKGLMLPAGMGVLSASQKALAASKTATSKRCYFDFDDMIKQNANGYFPYTPPLPLLYGLRESLAMIEEEGLENIFARHSRLAGGVRAAVKAWGLSPCAKEPKWYSDTVTAIVVPPQFNAVDVISTAYNRYNMSLGAGLSQVAGKVFRIGHLGDLNELMVAGALAGAEMAMADVGIPVTLGSGVGAAQAFWRSSASTQAKAA
ncbi:aminotransferase class V-fold PLP-dependent enzyme [Methylocella sp.]|uniref:aminotransferase class V-fold PLP-dependent enzyme n=1 Tax=Methylocella sp. TaxID=1978226 RepID=UPI0037839B02